MIFSTLMMKEILSPEKSVPKTAICQETAFLFTSGFYEEQVHTKTEKSALNRK
jgi:hypothetical protein